MARPDQLPGGQGPHPSRSAPTQKLRSTVTKVEVPSPMLELPLLPFLLRLLGAALIDIVQAQHDLPRDQDDDDPLQGVGLPVLQDLQKVLDVLLHQLQLERKPLEPLLELELTPELLPDRPVVSVLPRRIARLLQELDLGDAVAVGCVGLRDHLEEVPSWHVEVSRLLHLQVDPRKVPEHGVRPGVVVVQRHRLPQHAADHHDVVQVQAAQPQVVVLEPGPLPLPGIHNDREVLRLRGRPIRAEPRGACRGAPRDLPQVPAPRHRVLHVEEHDAAVPEGHHEGALVARHQRAVGRILRPAVLP
mmetsp:Transcript_6317/g.21676  ORF Transcript_6317/g.21676 Transcript_6317/m.21676 type:complete len:303 (+) Transcript_6317:538-1446(+)